MIPSSSQLASSGSQPRRYHQNEPRTPYGSRGLTMQSHRPKPKGTTPIQMNSSLDWSNANRAYNSPFILVPNSTVFNGVPTVPSFLPNPALGKADQTGQYSYLPAGVWPSPMVTGAYSSWPYMANYDMQYGTKQPAWNVPHDNKEAHGEDNAQVQYYPSNVAHGIDGTAMSNYPYGGMVPPQLGQIPLPLQMMKTHNGYVVQDLEALTQQDPAIPRAVPAMWTNPSDLTLAKCLENREGITNVYIRGFLPETTDEVLHAYAARFGKIDRCKAIVDLDTGLCKGFGFVQYFNFESCENCIRGFFYLGYQASFAQKSRNSRLKDLEDRSSTNIYCTNIPIDWTEADLRRHFEPWRVVSEKISRDEKTGVSKEVGFARFESREVAEKILTEFHNVTKGDGVKLLLRFADTKAQKILKQQSNERRAYRAGEYNYSVEVVQGSTPSPGVRRSSHLTPNSQVTYTSPAGVDSDWTPATSISPCQPHMKNPSSSGRSSSLSPHGFNALENTPPYRTRAISLGRRSYTDLSGGSSNTVVPTSPTRDSRKENIRAVSTPPGSSQLGFISPTTSST
ncbi:Nucleotide-binding alpha-beta plait [Penicillium bovifimosum]|uniref:Nucleotide-binding alpha-beta plait n=1 Tax=Penicillium bovifimosum TaxID=126998 RepID=A0A9W9KTY8_9EURO|nr:Nucleotide-binding alpha-beta plait [Penicillium bovifimosum]XP_056517397.1 Nucleotide-binding alpha-beta plait [Penicillium bovifimosum]KAJ5120876.1 Nucleotide-binding alpha-beta plait [Penicillium bovifimosum]KAJ5120893.1 Nucleotide-binding alpha-beta plait [Penicillium bovifimosum]